MAKRDAKPTSRLLNVTVVFTAVLSLFIIFHDLMEARIDNSAFYFSESVLFSSFWWIFPPLLFVQFALASTCKSKVAKAMLLLVPIAVHLFAFPAVMWLFSTLYYFETFSYQQSLKYELTEHSVTIAMVYILPVSFFKIYNSKSRYTEPDVPVMTIDPVSSFEVMEGKKQISIATSDILFFSDNPPYTTIHHGTKQHLSNETLKSVSSKTDSNIFVQIHKSVIVNLLHVNYYQSRHNGEYDLVTDDDTVLRVSRHYARDFKTKFASRPQHTV